MDVPWAPSFDSVTAAQAAQVLQHLEGGVRDHHRYLGTQNARLRAHHRDRLLRRSDT